MVSHTTRVTQTTNIGLKTCSSVSGTRRLNGSFSIILPKVSCSFPFLKSLNMLLKKLLFVEYLSFRDEGIQTILLLGYRFCGCQWFTSSCCFWSVLSWKRSESFWADADTNESLLIIIYLTFFSMQVPQNKGERCCSIFFLFNSRQPRHQLIRYLFANCGLRWRSWPVASVFSSLLQCHNKKTWLRSYELRLIVLYWGVPGPLLHFLIFLFTHS